MGRRGCRLKSGPTTPRFLLIGLLLATLLVSAHAARQHQQQQQQQQQVQDDVIVFDAAESDNPDKSAQPHRTTRSVGHQDPEDRGSWLADGLHRVKRFLFDDLFKATTTEAPKQDSFSEELNHNSVDEEDHGVDDNGEVAPPGELRKTRQSGEEYNNYDRDDDEDDEDDDDDADDGSTGHGHPITDGSGSPHEEFPSHYERAVYRVSFVVREPYRQELSDRNSQEYRELSRELEEGLQLVMGDGMPLDGYVGTTLIRVQPRPDSFEYYATVDIAFENFRETPYHHSNSVKKSISDALDQKLQLGNVPVSAEDFTFRKLDESSRGHRRGPDAPDADDDTLECNHDEMRCTDGSRCIPIARRCDGYGDCRDGSDEHGCPPDKDDDDDDNDDDKDDVGGRIDHEYDEEEDEDSEDYNHDRTPFPTQDSEDYNHSDERTPFPTEEPPVTVPRYDDLEGFYGPYPDLGESYHPHHPDPRGEAETGGYDNEEDFEEEESRHHPGPGYPVDRSTPSYDGEDDRHHTTPRYEDRGEEGHRYPEEDHRSTPGHEGEGHRYPEEGHRPTPGYGEADGHDEDYDPYNEVDRHEEEGHRYPDEDYPGSTPRHPGHPEEYPDLHPEEDHRHPDRHFDNPDFDPHSSHSPSPPPHVDDRCRADDKVRCSGAPHVTICASQICDDQPDCPGGTDEQGCPAECEHGEFSCDVSRCIAATQRCDGRRDCDDGTDEHDCHAANTCSPYEFRCDDGQCIPEDLKCDGRHDCSRGEDERDCRDCTPYQFRCDNSECIDDRLKCNGRHDCSDGSDERDCDEPEHTCQHDEFQCKSGTCISVHYLCDQTFDCADGSDESDEQCGTDHVEATTPGKHHHAECDSNQFRCRDGTCIADYLRCDRRRDCIDGSDEDECGTCTADQFRCANGVCIDGDEVCDGNPNCYDGDDEQDCPVSCEPYEFECDGKCLPDDVKCDGYSDCVDGKDELYCSSSSHTTHAPTCSPYEFTCGSGECISARAKCDRRPDCRDQSDERDCDCRPGEFRCSSGECISDRQRCDRVADCRDASDERECAPQEVPATTPRPHYPPTSPPTRCPYGTQSCAVSNQCVASNQWCDGRPDCADGSDERNCVGHEPLNLKTYPSEQVIKETIYREGREVVFQCRDEGSNRARVRWTRPNGAPLPPGSRDLNGRLEIPNIQVSQAGAYVCEAQGFPPSTPGSSVTVYLNVEPYTAPTYRPSKACGLHEATCGNGDCIPKHLVCNGEYDCADGSDESRCSPHGCEPNEFRCSNKKCVLKSWRCDSDDDCGDNSDEEYCATTPPDAPCKYHEFTCASGDQCVPKAYHCDMQRDCLDGSDERGCTPPEIVQPPSPPMKVVTVGSELVITCTAVGVPTPEISWRLNWGHVPAKCKMTSVDGRGELVCPDIQKSDEGAYSCEAITSTTTKIAVPDLVLVVITGNAVCPAGQFNDEARVPSECIKCFCFGATTNCSSADLFTYSLPPPFVADSTVGVRVGPRGDVSIGDPEPAYRGRRPQLTQHDANGATLYISGLDSRASGSGGYPYLPVPDSFSGNQLKSYGGYIKYNVEFRGYGEPTRIPDVILVGNGYTLTHTSREPLSPSSSGVPRAARLFEGEWDKVRGDGSGVVPASREDIMMVLARVEKVLIKMQYVEGNTVECTLSDITMDSAGVSNVGQGPSNFVEECRCPAGYTGLSCESCAPGYVRQTSGPWLGRCHREPEVCSPGHYGDPSRGVPCRVCPCPLTNPSNQFARTCSLGPDGDVVCDCATGYEGRRCERCAAGYEGNPTRPGDRCRPEQYIPPPPPEPARYECDPAGSHSVRPDPRTGLCECKESTTGPRCDRCKENAFHLDTENQFGCISCFCMGITQQCTSSRDYRDQISTSFAHSSNEFALIESQRKKTPITQGLQVDPSRRELVYRSFSPARRDTFYWSLPSRFLGDRVTSYGGVLNYTIRHVPAPGGNSRNSAHDVELIGNDVQLKYFSKEQPHPDQQQTFTVPLLEQYWQRTDGNPVNREHMLMALADLENIFIKATYTTMTEEVGLSLVTLETSDERNTGGRRASAVEHCSCPAGYVGRSCEDCAPGYTRTGGGLYLGLCEPCQCNGRSESCDQESGACYDCRDNYTGENCDECAVGYLEIDGRCVAETSNLPYACNCNNNGTVPNTGCDNGRCVCKTNVEGVNCDKCREGTFGLAEDNTEGCVECFCSGVTSQCEHGRSYQTEEIPMDVFDHSFTLTDSAGTERLRGDDFNYNYEVNQICYDYPPPANDRSERLFWSLPRAFTGDKVLSYGGHLTFTRKNQEESYHLDDEDVILRGNGLEIHWSAGQNGYAGVKQDGDTTVYEVPLVASQWRTMTHHYPRTASRSDLMNALSNLEAVLVRATTSERMRTACISDVKMDQAVTRFTGRTSYRPVEVCRCPSGYQGTSCQGCSAGYYRDGSMCRQCPCGPNSDSCSAEANGRVRCHCSHGYSGERCDVYGDNQVLPPPPEVPPPAHKPTITVHISEPTLQIVEIGSTVRLHCNARSLTDHSPLSVTWEKQGGELPRDRALDDRRGLLVITDVTVYDAGVYVCRASDAYSFVTESATVQVGNLGSPPYVSVPADIYVNEGESARLRCEVQGNPRPSVHWSREDGAPFNPSVQVFENELVISGATQHDSGRYRCTATSSAGTHAGITFVQVQRTPSDGTAMLWIDRPEYRGSYPVQEVSLRCRGGEQGRPFEWHRYNDNLPHYAEDSRDGVLLIRDARPEDSGLYLCSQTTSEGRYLEANVTVVINHDSGSSIESGSHYPPNQSRPRPEVPIVWVGAPRYTVHQGQSLEVLCEVKNSPQAHIKWTKLGESMPNNVYQRGPYLHVNDCQPRDAGVYVCLAVNPDGVSAQNSTEVYVERLELPQILIYPEGGSHVTRAGSSAMFQCQVRAGAPEPTVEWTRVDRRPLGQNAQIVQPGVLRLDNVAHEDAGSYLCRASNAAGSTEASISLEIQEPPRVVIYPDERELTVSSGQLLTLTCTSQGGSPRPELSWRHHPNARVEEDHERRHPAGDRVELTIRNVQQSDEGEFTCTAHNAAGSDSRTIRLIVGPRRGDIPGAIGNDIPLDPEYGSYDHYGPGDPHYRPEGPHYNPEDRRPHDESDYAPNTQQELEGYLNGTVNMTCRTIGSPHVMVRWQRSDGRPLPVHHTQHSGVLTLQSLQYEDAGDYECVGTGPRGEPKFRVHTRLTVYEPLRLQLEPPKQIVRIGQDAQIVCSATGSHVPIHLRWEPVDRPMPRSVVTRDGIMQFNRIVLHDAGSYVCIGRDARGSEAQSTAVVIVQDSAPPAPHYPGGPNDVAHHPGGTRTQAAYVNSNVELRCELPGASAYDHTPNVRWDRDGGRHLPRGSQVIGAVLRMTEVQPQDAGRYWCSLTDRDGRLQREYVELRVEPPVPTDLPTMIIDPSRPSPIRPGDNLDVICSSTEHEDVVTWTRPDKDMPYRATVYGNTLRIANVQPEDAGPYLCSSRTSYGVPYSQQYDLHVEDSGYYDGSEEQRPYDPRGPADHDEQPPYGHIDDSEERSLEDHSGPPSDLQGPTHQEGPRYHDDHQPTHHDGHRPTHEDGHQPTHEDGYQPTHHDGHQPTHHDGHEPAHGGYQPVDEQHQRRPAHRPAQVSSARMGEGVKMSCDTDMAGNRLQYAWSKRGFALPNEVQTDEQILELSNVKESDAGLYVCTVKNGTDTFEIPSILLVTGTIPRFTRSADSYLEYPTLQDAYTKFDFALTFKPEQQNGLLLYNGQFSPASSGDFISLALVDGVPEFRYNLGAGVTILKAPEDLVLTPGDWHQISVSRSRKEAVMYVDGQGPFKTMAKGKHIGLDLKQPLFVGGVPAAESLPEGVPKEGFEGCISGLTLNKRDASLLGDALVTGDGVSDCETCSSYEAQSCHNGGRCQEAREAPGWRCLCQEGFSGHDCSRSGDVCYPGACGAGKCSDAPSGGFECACPFGKTGRRCELTVAIAEPSFKGDGYMTLPPPKRRARFDLEVRPEDVTKDGLILYCAESEKGHGDFVSLALKGGHLEFKFDTGANPTVVRSNQPLTPGKWVKVSAGRHAGEAKLSVSGQPDMSEKVRGPRKPLALHTKLYVGGYDTEKTTLNPGVGVEQGFVGCVKDIDVAGLAADYSAIDDSANVGQCESSSNMHEEQPDNFGNVEDNLVIGSHDETYGGHEDHVQSGGDDFGNRFDGDAYGGHGGDAFGGHGNDAYPGHGGDAYGGHGVDAFGEHDDRHHQTVSPCDASPCSNGGLCRVVPGTFDFMCQCPEGFTGRTCDEALNPCETLRPCQNGGSCKALGGSYKCYCPLGHSGINCEDVAEFDSSVSFAGDGYVELSRGLLPHTDDQSATEVIALSLSTNSSNGLIFWHGQKAGTDGGEKDYISLAVVDSFLEFSYDLGSGPAHVRNEVLRVDDGAVHNVVLKRTGKEASVEIDGLFTEYGESEGDDTEMDCPGNIYVGGAPDIFSLTGGKYSTGFKGCIYDLEIQDERSIDLKRKSLSGVNVKRCTSTPTRNLFGDDAMYR